MKTSISISLLMFLFLAPFTSSAQSADVDTSKDASCAIIPVNLRYGLTDAKTNGAVSLLQDFLNSHGYLTTQPTGFFGSMTRTAVIAFQTANGIPATPPGFVGPVTRAKIQAIDCNTPISQANPVLQPSLASVQSSNNQVSKKAVITSIESAGNPAGTITANEKAVIRGTGLGGKLTIQIGNQEPQILNVIGTSDMSAEFTVPARKQAARVNVVVTNSSGVISNSYEVNIDVVKQNPPVITNIQSSAHPEGTVDAGSKAFIYGTGLKGKLIIKIGNKELQLITIDNNSDTSAEFIVPTRALSSVVSISVTNESGLISNSYSTNIDVN